MWLGTWHSGRRQEGCSRWNGCRHNCVRWIKPGDPCLCLAARREVAKGHRHDKQAGTTRDRVIGKGVPTGVCVSACRRETKPGMDFCSTSPLHWGLHLNMCWSQPATCVRAAISVSFHLSWCSGLIILLGLYIWKLVMCAQHLTLCWPHMYSGFLISDWTSRCAQHILVHAMCTSNLSLSQVSMATGRKIWNEGGTEIIQADESSTLDSDNVCACGVGVRLCLVQATPWPNPGCPPFQKLPHRAMCIYHMQLEINFQAGKLIISKFVIHIFKFWMEIEICPYN